LRVVRVCIGLRNDLRQHGPMLASTSEENWKMFRKRSVAE
jgi:hypothetical protein